MRHLALAALIALSLSGCGQSGDTPGSGELKVEDAWVRLSPVSGRPAAAYFTVQGGGAAERLTAVRSAVVGRIELHEGGIEDGMMTMKPLASIDIPAGVRVQFAPGGNHAMLFDVDARITPGTGVPLNFAFASGKRIEVEAKSVAAGGEAPTDAHAGH